ncbi:carotenoid oxygenase family protein [Sphingomonas bacterium]|uniref:8'-apo-carotenoid 13,14-cleaving dioxygenase n=1 Tax=Sphingomonas bacterium TaxID=1895847 RepID=UPI0020C6F647|nr:carotenoid oxygenase family protein [Sphingomonas bacterium]
MSTNLRTARAAARDSGNGYVDIDVERARSMTALADGPKPHPFLEGVHAPMTEELTLTTLDVVGTIPATLDGRYLRIGPNPITPDPVGYHMFMGDGMVHGLALKNGQALWYRNRWIRSTAVSEALNEAPAPGPRKGRSDTVNTNVVAIGGRTWALVEAGANPVELTDTLETVAHNAFDGTLDGSFTAHPHRDHLTGEHHAIAYEGAVPNEVRYVVISAEGAVTRELSIPVEHGPAIHDCSFTQSQVLIYDLPVTLSPAAIRAAMAGGERFVYRWNPEHRARVGLLPRAGGADDIVWCDVEPCYIFHAANAYDLPDGRVVAHVVAYDDYFIDSQPDPDATGRLERWTIDPATCSVERIVVDACSQEFPTTDERRNGLANRYAFTMEVGPGGIENYRGTRLYRHDLETGGKQAHDFGADRHPGEFVFTPRDVDAAEGDGWLMGLVVNRADETTDLAIIDTADFTGPPVAQIRIPHRVPAGFHGNWIAS